MNTHADVLIVTVTKVESKAVFEVFQEATGRAPVPMPMGDKVYHDLGVVNGTSVFTVLSEMGTGGLGASQQTVQKGIDALSPGAVILVGIAFGVNEQKQAIGDVLVSQQIRLYDLQRVGADQIILRGDKPHASPWLIDRCRNADLHWDGATVRVGLVLSGEKLVDNVDYREQLRGFCQLPPENVPLTFGQYAPPVFGQYVPLVCGQLHHPTRRRNPVHGTSTMMRLVR